MALDIGHLAALLAQGLSRQECAAALGVGFEAVKSAMRRHGLRSQCVGGCPPTYARSRAPLAHGYRDDDGTDAVPRAAQGPWCDEPADQSRTVMRGARLVDAPQHAGGASHTEEPRESASLPGAACGPCPAPRAPSGRRPDLYSGGPGSSPGRGSDSAATSGASNGPVDDDAGRASLLIAERRLERLQRQLSDERRRRWTAEDEAERALRSAGIMRALAGGSVELPPIVPHRTGKSHDPAVPVLLVSDVHVGERVRSASVNGLNEYDDEIAERRMAFLFEGFAWHVERHAQFYSVNEAVLWLGGDLIAGLIHEEQAASNCLMTPPAVMLAQELVARGIDYLLERCRFLRRLRVVCSFGNHGRVTKKIWRSIRPETSYEWIIYHGLRSRFSREPRVEWQIADGPLAYAEIFGLTFRFTHGDSVGYQGGIGGLTIPLKKRCLAWDKSRRADVTVLGHFHQLHHWGYATVNGSVVGWNPYAADVGCEYELPKQGLLLVTDWGVQTFTEVYCDPDRAPKERAVA